MTVREVVVSVWCRGVYQREIVSPTLSLYRHPTPDTYECRRSLSVSVTECLRNLTPLDTRHSNGSERAGLRGRADKLGEMVGQSGPVLVGLALVAEVVGLTERAGRERGLRRLASCVALRHRLRATRHRLLHANESTICITVPPIGAPRWPRMRHLSRTLGGAS